MRLYGDLKDRTFRFAQGVLGVVDELPNGSKGWEIGRQLIRSGTSVGANLREADHAFSDSDFLFKCSLARKEACEAQYWLELCRGVGLLKSDESERLIKEADEIMRILAAMIKRTKDRLKPG